jgi:hypothetical protein
LAALADLGFDRFQAFRRREREQFQLSRSARLTTIDVATAVVLPIAAVEDGGGSSWSRYSVDDAFRLACAADLERAGLDFHSACRFVLNANVRLGQARWAARGVDREGGMWHATGKTPEEASQRGGRVVVLLDAHASLEAMAMRASKLGLMIVDGEFVREAE